MNERIEIYKHIFEISEMAIFTIKDLRRELKTKDNKIKEMFDGIINEYTEFKNISTKFLKKKKKDFNKTKFMTKIMSSMGIKKEVISDNSDAHMADMLIQGISMGTIQTSKLIDQYKCLVKRKDIKLLKNFLKFQQEKIEDLKKFL